MRPTPALTLEPAKPWQQRASPLARAALVAYTVLIIYSGLAPLSGWHDLGIAPFAFLSAPLPRRLPPFDLLVNVLGYLPFGALMVLAVHPRLQGGTAVLTALGAGALLAGVIEALQTYLSSRVASNVDLASNAVGALIGAACTAPFVSTLIDRGRLQQLRARWFSRDASALLVLLALWPAAQITTTPMLFGNGRLVQGDPWIDAWAWLEAASTAALFGPAEFVLAEALVVVAATLAVGLTLAALSQPGAPRLRTILVLIGAAIAVKTYSYAWLLTPGKALAWLTPGAIGGLALALLALAVAAQGRRGALLGGAFAATLVWVLAVNLVPDNPYAEDLIAPYRYGRLRHFTAIADWLSVAWPPLLLASLAVLALRRRSRRGSA